MTHYVYVDNRDRVPGGSASDFTIALPSNLELGDTCTYRIDQFRIVNSFETITSKNRYIYSLEPGMNLRVVSLGLGYYSASELEGVIRNALNAASHEWSVNYYSANNSLVIHNPSFQYHFITGAESAAGTYHPGAWPSGCSASNPCSFNAILQNFAGSAAVTDSHTYTTPYLNIQRYDYVQLRSSHLSSPHVTSARMDHDVLLKIDLDVPVGQVVNVKTPGLDSLQCGRVPHRTLDFQITDRFGAVVSMQDGTCNFILVLYG